MDGWVKGGRGMNGGMDGSGYDSLALLAQSLSRRSRRGKEVTGDVTTDLPS